MGIMQVATFKDLLKEVAVYYENSDDWLEEQLDRALNDCVKESHRLRGLSQMDLTMKFKPGPMGQLLITAEMKVKKPKIEPKEKVAFTDNMGRLTLEDPQIKIPFNNVEHMEREAMND